MKLRLTLLDPERLDVRVDVVIEAAVGTPFAAVGDRLAAALRVPATTELRFHCAGQPVPGTQPLGLPPLLQGAVLTLSADRVEAGENRLGQKIHVIAGPDAGAVVPLTTGHHLIGRGYGHPLQLADPEVSRTHAELIVGTDRIEIRDAGSTNGTWLDGRRLGAEPQPLPATGRVRIGSCLIALQPPDRPTAGGTLDGRGHLMINRSPQLRPDRSEVAIRFPAPPQARPAGRLPWLTMLLPLLLAVPLAVLWNQPTFLLFALLTPLLLLGQYVTDRRTRRGELAELQDRYDAARAQRQRDLEQATAADAAHLETTRPDLARLAVTAGTPTDELWPRSVGSAEFLLLRVGRGPHASPITVHRPTTDDAGPEAVRFIHPDVPVALDLAATRVLGICGPRQSVLGLARSLLGQVAVLHSPREVGIQVFSADPGRSPEWHWVDWLPHHESVLGQVVSDPEPAGRRYRVIVLDGVHALRRRPEVAGLLRWAVETGARPGAGLGAGNGAGFDVAAGPGVGAGGGGLEAEPLVLCLDRAEQDLPVECAATIALDPDRQPDLGPAVLRRTGAAAARFAPDLAGQAWAERLARDLAPLRDATPEPGQDLPDTIRLLDLLADIDRVRPTDPADLARHWLRPPQGEDRSSGHRVDPGPLATLGLTASGPFRIDLRRDGPHLLIGGTTGAGKSQLLQTLVAALAVNSGPDEMSFLLIDYKGGAAFRECLELPHVAGMITDLDPALARRALASLTAELRRRERLLRSATCADIAGYGAARATRAALPALPRLVVIVDEFRVLAEELPEFVSGLVRTATVGRSLGVHLVLATQRPAGAVSAEIIANVSLRIALRVNDGSDSRDLIDDPAAAVLPADRPGRALARTGSGPLVRFQTAVVTGSDPDRTEQGPTVQRLGPGLQPDPRPGLATARHLAPVSPPAARAGTPVDRPTDLTPVSLPAARAGTPVDRPTDLVLIARAARAAAERLGLAPVSPPWLEPLPERLSWQRLLDLNRLSSAASSPDERRKPVRLPFGLIDLPAEQRQEVLAWRLDGSHLAVCGGPRSGRSTTLRTLARAIGRMSEELHVYVLDGAGALATLHELPHLEAVIPVHNTERAERLLKLLATEINARQGSAESTWHGPGLTTERLRDERGGTEKPGGTEELGETAEPGAQEVGVEVVLLIDGWEALTTAWGAVDHGRLIDQLFGILRDGPAVGLHAAISGGRTLLTGAISSLLSERVLLRFADPADAVLAGVPSVQVLKSPPAGRGLLLGPRFPEVTEIQVALDQGATEPEPSGPQAPWGQLAPLDQQTPQGQQTPLDQQAPLGQQVLWGQELPLGQPAESQPRSRPPAGRRSWRIPELPRRLEHGQLINIWERQVRAGESEAMAGSICVPVGFGGDEALALTLDLTLATVALVVGPSGSGRTNALHCLADGLVRLGEPVVWVSLNGRGFNGRGLNGRGSNSRGYNSCGSGSLDDHGSSLDDRNHSLIGRRNSLHGRSGSSAGSPDSGLTGVPIVAAGGADAASSLASLLAARPDSTVLVDDTQSPGTVDSLRGALEDQLTAHLGLGRVVVACSAAELLGAYRGLLAAARTARSGLLLNPSGPGDAEVFGLRPERRPPGPPGRALLVEDGRATTVQLALTPALDLTPAHELPPALEATPAVEFHRPQLELPQPQHRPQHGPAATNGMKATNGIRAPTRRPIEEKPIARGEIPRLEVARRLSGNPVRR